MEDISQKISDLLNSPDGMEKIKNAAQTLLGSQTNDTQNNTDQSGFSLPQDLLQNAGNIGGILKVINLFKNKKEDSRIDLLLALKPHLSTQRAARVDKAVSLLKIAAFLPVLREEGLLESLGF